jgi:hypothetical protein
VREIISKVNQKKTIKRYGSFGIPRDGKKTGLAW